MEVERFWTSSWCTWGSFLFFLNRYLSVLGHIPVVLEYFWTTPSSLRKSLVSTVPPLRFGRPPSSCIELRALQRVGVRRLSTASGCILRFIHTPSCHSLQTFHQYFVVVVQLIVGGPSFSPARPASAVSLTRTFVPYLALLVLRTYALYDRSRKVLFVLVGTAVVIVSFSCVSEHWLAVRGVS
jgi:hypothetical protein